MIARNVRHDDPRSRGTYVPVVGSRPDVLCSIPDARGLVLGDGRAPASDAQSVDALCLRDLGILEALLVR